jgi:AcrR family transcriptional regulator
MTPSTEATTPSSDRAAETRRRILDAARAEFAEYGFGGGRIDRIAVGAGANKERIYAYFGDKRALFVATIVCVITEVAETIGSDAEGIVDFAGRVYDFIAGHPQTLRLLSWARLETDPWDEATAQLRGLPVPEELIARWQREGGVSSAWDPRDLYVIIWGLCEVWQLAPFRAEDADGRTDARRRELVQSIVRVLAAQEDRGGTAWPNSNGSASPAATSSGAG